MSEEPLTNAVIDRMQWLYDRTNALAGRPTAGPPVTDDFMFQDRRSGGVNFGPLDGAGFEALVLSNWDVSAGRVRLSMGRVVAVLGQRLAAYVEVIDYGGAEANESLVCICLGPGLQKLHRMIAFDCSDVDAAITELHRIQAELDD